MRRLVSLLLLPAGLVIAGCDGDRQKSGAPGATSAAITSASAAASGAPVAARRPAPTREGGALVRSPADDALYVADEDHGVVRRIALPFDPAAPVVTVPMPGLPAQVLALDDRVLVTIRSEGGVAPAAPGANDASSASPAGSASNSAAAAPPNAPAGSKSATPSRIPVSPTGAGLLLIMRPDAAAGLVEVARVTLPADAWGIAVTPDEKTALISSAWTHQVSAVDITSAKKTWSIDVPREPRGVVVRKDGASAYVTHLVGGMITRLDDIAGQPKARPVSLPPSPLRSPSGKTLDGTLAYSAALSPDGSRLFVPRHAIGAIGEAAWFGASSVDVLLTADDTPLAEKRDSRLPRVQSDLTRQMRGGMINPETPGTFPLSPHTVFSAPRATLYRKSTSTVLVASEGTNRILEFDARAVDPTMFVSNKLATSTEDEKMIPVAKNGGAPTGMALSADESILWVFCRATSDVIELRFKSPPPAKEGEPKYTPPRLRLADDLLGELDGRGRRIFYDATDSITSGGVSCAGCHPEGRDDGHVWHEAAIHTRSGDATNFLGDSDQAPMDKTASVGYPRQTPIIAGRVAAKGPYGWHGESPDLIARLKGGFGLHRWGTLQPSYGDGELLGRAQYLTLFIRHGLIPPPRDVRPLTPQEARGKEIFSSNEARCVRCHVPDAEYTDRTAYPLFPKLPPVAGFEDEKDQQYKTPSLFFVGGSPPYYHDGRASTLEVLIENNGDRMGRTSHLSPEDRAALVAFLRTL